MHRVLSGVISKFIQRGVVQEEVLASHEGTDEKTTQSPLTSLPAAASPTSGIRGVEAVSICQKEVPKIFSWRNHISIGPTTPSDRSSLSPDIISFYASLFFPFVDGYFVMAVTICILREQQLTKAAVIKLAQDMGERLYFDGQLYHYECIMSETLGNAFQSLMDMKVHKYFII